MGWQGREKGLGILLFEQFSRLGVGSYDAIHGALLQGEVRIANCGGGERRKFQVKYLHYENQPAIICVILLRRFHGGRF